MFVTQKITDKKTNNNLDVKPHFIVKSNQSIRFNFVHLDLCVPHQMLLNYLMVKNALELALYINVKGMEKYIIV